MLCPVAPKQRNVAVVACRDFQSVLSILHTAKQELPDVIQAFEYFDRASLEVVRAMTPNLVYPFDRDFDHYVLVEIAKMGEANAEMSSDEYGSSGSDLEPSLDMDRLLGFIESIEHDIIVSRIGPTE